MFKFISIHDLLTAREIQITISFFIAILSINIFIYVLFFLYSKVKDSWFKQQLREIIYELDEYADTMENKDKRILAINEVKELLGWIRLTVPSFLIGFVIDTEVATIRKIQLSTNIKEGE